MPILSQYIDPFDGLAASIVTSSVIDARDAFDLTCSWRTSAGTASPLTYQVANVLSQASAESTTWNAAWSNFTAFGTAGSGTSTWEPPLGHRFARILRTPSGASYIVEMNKLIR